MRPELIIYIALAAADMLLLVPRYTKSKYDHTPKARKLVWKGLCIGTALALLVFGTVMKAVTNSVNITNILLILGMLLCAFGDIELELHFVIGGFLFGFGHIAYIAAIIFMNDFSIVSLYAYIVMLAVGTTLTFTHLGKKHRGLLLSYNAVISASFALALPFVLSGELPLILLGAGVCSLMVSDWLLAKNKVLGCNFTWSLISLVFYFGGQLLIASYPFLN